MCAILAFGSGTSAPARLLCFRPRFPLPTVASSAVGLALKIFFALPGPQICPFISNNEFIGSQQYFHQRFQVYRIVYELARFHLGRHALDATSSPAEVFDWNKCVTGLNSLESVINPTNLELYVACR